MFSLINWLGQMRLSEIFSRPRKPNKDLIALFGHQTKWQKVAFCYKSFLHSVHQSSLTSMEIRRSLLDKMEKFYNERYGRAWLGENLHVKHFLPICVYVIGTVT